MNAPRVSAQYQFGEVVRAGLNKIGQLEGVIRLEDGRRVQFHERDHREVVMIFSGQDAGLGVRFREDLRKGFLWDIEMPGIGTKIICRVSEINPLDKLFTATQWAYAKDWAQLMAIVLWAEAGEPTDYPDTFLRTKCPEWHTVPIELESDLVLPMVRRMAHEGIDGPLLIGWDRCISCKNESDLIMHDTLSLMDEQLYFVLCPMGHRFEALYGSELERRAMEHGAITSDRAMPITQDECEQCDPNGHRVGDGIKELILGVTIPALNEIVDNLHPDITIHHR